MNDIGGQDDGCEQGCCEGARVPDYQEHVEDEVQNKPNVIKVTFKVIVLLNAMVKRKTCVFQTIEAEKEEAEGGQLAKDKDLCFNGGNCSEINGQKSCHCPPQFTGKT